VAKPAKIESTRRIAATAALLTILILVAGGVLAFLLTSQVEIEFAQDPNPVEAHEAARKLALFNEAQAAKRKGFVRFSEVEINSFLQGGLNGKTNSVGKAPVPKPGVKNSVLLSANELTFVTWEKHSLFGFEVPFVWQRSVVPVKGPEGWSFATREMRVGRVEVPQRLWGAARAFLGKSDECLKGREDWLSRLPAITLARNELSQAPELRLYTYVPELWHH
jgi:hypothetical protein